MSATPKFTLRAQAHLNSPEQKRYFNAELFREVAPRYDLITRLLSFGRDAAWKRDLIANLPDLQPATCLDLACGTGDLTRALAKRFPRARVIGFDLTPAMLELAKRHTNNEHIHYQQGDMQALPFANESMDVITGGYALRNAPDLALTLREIARVLRPGGTFSFLDFSKSLNPTLQRAGHALLKFWGCLWGLLLHGHADVYGYIADSLRTFPDRAALRVQLDDTGLHPVAYRTYMGGLVEWIRCRKTTPRTNP